MRYLSDPPKRDATNSPDNPGRSANNSTIISGNIWKNCGFLIGAKVIFKKKPTWYCVFELSTSSKVRVLQKPLLRALLVEILQQTDL